MEPAPPALEGQVLTLDRQGGPWINSLKYLFVSLLKKYLEAHYMLASSLDLEKTLIN